MDTRGNPEDERKFTNQSLIPVTLKYLHENPEGRTVKQIVKDLGIHGNSLNGTLRSLEKKGLARWEKQP